MPLNALSSVVVATTGTPPEFDWSAEIEKNLTAVERIGKMLIAERFKAKKGPGADLALMSREAELIRCVSRIYVLNSIHRVSRFPPLAQWLLYVNLAPTEMRALLERVRTIQELAALNDKQIVDMCESLRFHAENRRRLRKSSYSLKRYILKWQSDGIEPLRVFSDKDLAWLSFDYSTPSRERSNISESGTDITEQQDSCASDSGS
ncbi:unnamed protein product, partial [Enterobius vermicularis]|uniref:SAM_KSR1 domain-containing protein n=1 Tax=Enterobius vermicularis TaxID=51028 RepID=A0A0N4VR52_ENTVE